VCPRPIGPVNCGSVDPKIDTVGTPRNAAKWIVPVSFVNRTSQRRSCVISSDKVVRPVRSVAYVPRCFATFSETERSFLVPKMSQCKPSRAESSQAAAPNSGHRFAGPYSAPGHNPTGPRSGLQSPASGNALVRSAPIRPAIRK